MNRFIRVLTVHSARDLFRYKSFFLLVFALIAVDRFVHVYVRIDRAAFTPPHGQGWGLPLAGAFPPHPSAKSEEPHDLPRASF